MSIKVMTYVWEHAPVDKGSLLVLLALADFADDAGTCYPAVPTLARKARLEERQVQRVVKGLIAKDLLEVDWNKGPSGVNVYRVRQNVGGDIAVSKMSHKPSRNHQAQHSLDKPSPASRKRSNVTSVNTKPRARGEGVLGDIAFMAELRERYGDRDIEYESVKWLDHIETNPPRGNYRNSLRNWLERSPAQPEEDAQVAWLRHRYERGRLGA